MFPLGTALVPGAGIPLHVFEPRYRQMVIDILGDDGAPEFGQVLITHGREAGGGDQRADVGTLTRMADIRALDGGRYAFVGIGMRRIKVLEWLPDDPYPLARVEDWPDEAATPPSTDTLAAMVARVDAVLGLASELSGRTPSPLEVDVSEDPTALTFRLTAIAPIGEADRLRLLCATDAVARLGELGECLDDVEAMLRFRLS